MAGPWAPPRTTRSACGWATPAVKAARTHRLHHGRTADVRALRRSARERLVRAAHARAARRSRSAPTTATCPSMIAKPRAAGYRRTATSTRSVLTTCACTSIRAQRRVCTATANRPAACARPTGSCCRPREEFYYRRAHAEYRPLPPCAPGLSGHARTGARRAGAALSRARTRACSSRASSTEHADARFSRPSRAAGRPRSTGISMADTLAKRTLFTSSRWTSTPASTY